MRKLIFLAIVFLESMLAVGQDQRDNYAYNFGFEKNSMYGGSLPDGWFQWGHSYVLKTDKSISHGGKASLLIEPMGEKSGESFGCIAYAIPANFQAKEIELKAYMKLNNVSDGVIGLMLRIDGSSGMIAFNDMEERKIQGTRDWTHFSVKLPYPADAKTIFIGATLNGKGQLWVDDFQVLLDGKDITEAKVNNQNLHKAGSDKEFDQGSKISNIVLTDSKLKDLGILGKVWGYLKYYHPAVAAGEYNWDYELLRIVPKILEAKSAKERNAVINKWIASLGIPAQYKSPTQAVGEVTLQPDLSWINSSTLGKELAASLNKIKSAKRVGENFYIEKVLPFGMAELKNERPYPMMSYPDTGFRLLCLYRYWNIINYYFPYKQLINEDWNKVLLEYIPQFVNAKDELEYRLTVLSLITRVNDTYANIWDNSLAGYHGQKYAPLEVKFVENKVVVTNYFDESLGKKSGLKIGDVIEFVDGKPIQEIVKQKLALTPASNHSTKLRGIGRGLLRSNKLTLDVEYWNGVDTSVRQVELFYPYFFSNYQMLPKADTCFKLIDSDIAYLFLGAIKNSYLSEIMGKIENTKGLVIDLRCYPSENIIFTLSEFLLPAKKSFAKMSGPSQTTPGLFTIVNELQAGSKNDDYYKGKVVILVNEATQSQAELHAMAFRIAPRATVIGSATAGADGDVLKFVLPGGINTMISGAGVYYPDGRETQRIGIVPDIEVKPTIKGVREGRDELLESAIRIIRGG